MKKAIMTSISVLSILVILVTLFSCKPQTDKDEIKDESFGAVPVKIFKVKRQKISERLFYTGLIEPLRKTNITPDIGGKIAKIYVNEGDIVEEGQLLAELDTRASILQLQQAQAGLAVSEANQKDAKRNMERMERLIGEKAVSDQQYEKTKLAYEAAGAQLKQAQTTVNLANYQLDVSRMKAPFSGVVASKNAEVGDVINPMMGGFSPTSGVFILMDFSHVKINIDLSHQDVVRLKKGQAALLSISAYPNKTFQGRVALVNLTADPLTKKFKVEITVENKNLLLRPNTFGEVTIEVNTKYNALIIPQKAILENKYVFLVNDSVVSKIEVKLGLQNMDMVEITKGIKAGDQIVVEGNYGLEDGTKIDIKKVIE